MGEILAARVSHLIAWLNDALKPAEQDLLEMSGTMPDEWDAFFDSHPEKRSYALVARLLEIANNEYEEGLIDFTQLFTHLALDHIDRVVVPADRLPLRERLRPRLWLMWARTMRQRGNMAESLKACEEAIRLLERDPLASLDLAAARREQAVLLHPRGQTAAALRMLRDDVPLFLRLNDIRGAVRSLIEQGLIEIDVDPAAAEQTLRWALDLANTAGHLDSIARLHVYLGECAEAAGRENDAAAWFVQAATVVVQAGLWPELYRVQGGLARAIARTGHMDEAVEALTEATIGMEMMGTPNETATVALHLVDLLHLMGQPETGAALAAQLVRYFGENGSMRQAMQALSVVREAQGARSTLQSSTPSSTIE